MFTDQKQDRKSLRVSILTIFDLEQGHISILWKCLYFNGEFTNYEIRKRGGPFVGKVLKTLNELQI